MCKETTPMPLVCSYPCPVQAPPPAAGEETRAWLCTPPPLHGWQEADPQVPTQTTFSVSVSLQVTRRRA